MKHVADKLLQDYTEPVNLDFNHNNEEIMISARFIPEIEWFLVVVQRDVAEVSGSRKILIRSTIIGLLTTLIIILFSGFMLNYFHKKLEDAANIDILTKAHNRRAFNNQLEICCYKHERYGTPISIIMIDLDNFKKVNDEFGHKAGDDVLKTVSVLINTVKRPDDFFSRWGGDEFVILLESDISQAKALSERILAEQSKSETSVTFSIGVTELKDEDHEAFLKKADEAMYTAKGSGKNRIVVL
jgi:diguanylate cyclase (GGDEF)-like protein